MAGYSKCPINPNKFKYHIYPDPDLKIGNSDGMGYIFFLFEVPLISILRYLWYKVYL